MNKEEILNELNKVFRTTFDKPGIILKSETTAKDIDGWDSLSHVRMISEVEDYFAITFTMPEIMRFRDVGMMAETIEKKLKP